MKFINANMGFEAASPLPHFTRVGLCARSTWQVSLLITIPIFDVPLLVFTSLSEKPLL